MLLEDLNVENLLEVNNQIIWCKVIKNKTMYILFISF